MTCYDCAWACDCDSLPDSSITVIPRDKGRPNWELYLVELDRLTPEETARRQRRAGLNICEYGDTHGWTREALAEVLEAVGLKDYQSVPGDQLSKAAERKRSKARRGVA